MLWWLHEREWRSKQAILEAKRGRMLDINTQRGISSVRILLYVRRHQSMQIGNPGFITVISEDGCHAKGTGIHTLTHPAFQTEMILFGFALPFATPKGWVESCTSTKTSNDKIVNFAGES